MSWPAGFPDRDLEPIPEMVIELQRWVSERTPVIQEAVHRCPPGWLYRLKFTGQRCVIVSYDEPADVSVAVTVTVDAWNELGVQARVFGVALEDLEHIGGPYQKYERIDERH